MGLGKPAKVLRLLTAPMFPSNLWAIATTYWLLMRLEHCRFLSRDLCMQRT